MRDFPASATDVLIGFLNSLGLINPSEPTSRRATATVTTVTEGPVKATTKSVGVLDGLHEAFKKRLKQIGKQPDLYIETFPESPAAYLRKYHTMAREVHLGVIRLVCQANARWTLP